MVECLHMCVRVFSFQVFRTFSTFKGHSASDVRGRRVRAGISKLGEAVLLVLLEHPGQEGSMLYKQNHS